MLKTAVLGYYAVSSCKFFPVFQDSLLDSWTLRMGLIGCPKMLVRNYSTHCVIIQKGAVLCYFTVEASNHTVFWVVLVNSHLRGHPCVEDVFLSAADYVLTHKTLSERLYCCKMYL